MAQSIKRGDRIKTHGAIIRLGESVYGVCKPVALCTDWDRADLRWEDPIWGFERGIACNVVVTGETIIHQGGAMWLRGRIEWVKDDEPSTFETCMIRVEFGYELALTSGWQGFPNPSAIGTVKEA